jgi:hypothetical protein
VARVRRTTAARWGEERPVLRATLTVSIASAYIAAGLWLDRYVDLREQLLLGVLTAAVLCALLALHPPAVRLQTLAVVGIATMGEVVGSLIWGLYTYRLHNLPAFVPPGHGLVYLTGLSLATLMARRPRLLLVLAGSGAVAWGVAGLTVLPTADASGAMGCAFLVGVLLWTRRPVYAGVFIAVAALELYGTAIGTWTWDAVVPGLRMPQGNPPSGAASGYVVFDVLALALTSSGAAVALGLKRRVLGAREHVTSAEAPATAS